MLRNLTSSETPEQALDILIDSAVRSWQFSASKLINSPHEGELFADKFNH